MVYLSVSSGIVCNTLVLWKEYFKSVTHTQEIFPKFSFTRGSYLLPVLKLACKTAVCLHTFNLLVKVPVMRY